MATRVSLITLPDGALAVSKTPLSGDRRDRSAEGHWLERAAAVIEHDLADRPSDPAGERPQRAGVVPLIGIESTAGMPTAAVTIVTERVPGETLRTTWLAPAGVAAALALVANVLADLHAHGLVHGNLSADHIILDPAGPRLCSPHGAVTDPLADSIALGHCVRSMLDRWRRLDVGVPARDQWERLASSLEATDPLPLRRAARALERLASGTPSEAGGEPPNRHRRRPWGLIGAAAAAMLSLAGLAVVEFAPTRASLATSDIEVGGSRYQITSPSGSATVVEHACDHQPDVLVLDDDDLVWRFDPVDAKAEPGEATPAAIVAEVPGAQQLAIQDGELCPVVWAIGPAGRTLVIGESREG